MVEKAYQILLLELRKALFNEQVSIPENTVWNEVIKEAKEQTVLGIIGSEIPCAPVLEIEQGVAFFVRLIYEQDRLVKVLEKNNIPFVIIKGCAVAMYYPQPNLRTMGDVDILVSKERFLEAVNLLDASGYSCISKRNADNSFPDGVREVGYLKNGIKFELHHHFSVDGYNIDDILDKAIKYREYQELYGFRFPVLPKIENGLVLLGHIFQHLRGDAIGLRQIIDWEMFFHSVMDEKMWKKDFVPIAKQTGLYKIAVGFTSMCQKYLGLPVNYDLTNESWNEGLSDELIEIIIKNGNFGRKAMASTDGLNVRRGYLAVLGIGRGHFLDVLWKRGLSEWNRCSSIPIIKPFAFLYGIVKYLFKGIQVVIKNGHIHTEIREGKRRKRLFKSLGIRG